MTHQIVHCSYHKCLTVYYYRVMDYLHNRILRYSKGYHHFNSSIDQFYAESNKYRTTSLNNRAVELDRVGDCRITRFIRDPRDLVVSGYLYHKRGAENWCNRTHVSEGDWDAVNGVIPKNMGERSYSSYLQSLNEEEGLFAELEFREKHFASMLEWPENDSKVLLFRYEDILGNEVNVFSQMMRFYGMSPLERTIGLYLSRKFSAKKQRGRIDHIRNPSSGQWRQRFTPKLVDYFNMRYSTILDRYGYET